MLSGGIDSKIIAFYARKFCNLTCLTWCFEDRNMDESKEAKDAAKYMGLDWIPIQISRNQPGLKRLDPTIRFAPEKHAFRPLKNRMYEEARSLGVDVLLNGVWGDQIFRPLHHRFVQLRRRARLKWRHLFRTPWLSRVVEKELVSSGLTSIRYSERYERSLLGPRACQSD